jgi:parallel beta-helix repeat protein
MINSAKIYAQNSLDPSKKSIQAWIYPGNPACDASNEYKDGRFINTLKPEYLTLDSSGNIVEKVFSPAECNQYSSANANEVKNNSSFQFITVSGKKDNLKALLNKSDTQIKTDFVDPIVNFVNQIGYTGVELDFEHPTGGWNQSRWNRYKYIINELGKELHKPVNNKLLMIDGPGLTKDPTSTSYNQWNYSDFYSDNLYPDLPTRVDYVCVMAYDRYWDIWDSIHPNNHVTDNLGGVSPTAWVGQVIDYVKSEMTSTNINKIVIGLPSYGYHALSSDNFAVDTKKQTAVNPFYGVNPRDSLSHERYFTDADNIRWYYQDAIGMCEKVEFIRSKGIKHISVWHLGGNDWLNRFDINILNNSILDPDYKLPATCLPASSIVNNTSNSFPNQYYFSPTNITIDNQKDRNHYAKINSSTGSNILEFGGYSFTPPSVGNYYVSGFEVVVIGRTENNNSNLGDPLYKSDLFVQLSYNGQDAPPIPFSIYSHHAVCKLFGSTDDMMGLPVINGTINSSFKVKLYHSSGADAYITAVFVKPYYSVNPPPSPSCTYNTTPYNISTVMPVWSNTKLFNNDIVIKSGGVLTITGTVKFTEQAKIIVEPGGQLIVNGGTLTNLCNNLFWEGITVKGHNTQSQFDETQHGKIVLSNNATISNAIYGIQTLSTNNNDKGGGIINAWNANFVNNQTGVKMEPYSNPSLSNDISYFRSCNFITDNNYLSTTTLFKRFIKLYSVKGVPIVGCKFKNLSTITSSNYHKGKGISSEKSNFLVDNNGYVNTEFQDLEYGIYATGTHTSKPIQVRNTLFNNNIKGIYTLNCDYNDFTSNTFKIPDYYQSVSSNTVDAAYGIYIETGSSFTIEGNSFNKVDNAANKAAYGIIINGAGTAANTIYDNTFQNIEHSATLAQGINRSNSSSIIKTGLQILCNQYSLNNHDIAVNSNSSSDGIAEFQGAYAGTNSNEDKKKPAGNTFSKTGPMANYTDIANQGKNLTYYHHKISANSDIWYPFYSNPSSSLNGVFTVETQAIFPINDRRLACPAKALQTGLAKDPIAINTYITEKTLLRNSSKLIRDLWVDGGNTEGLRHDIKISMSWEAFDLYNELLLHSPKLSDEVLIDAIKKEDVLTPLMLKLILLANPQATRSDRVWEALINRTNPLPEAWIDEIKQGLEVISPIENLEADVSYYASERKTYLDMLKQYYLDDTTAIGMQSLIQLLASETDIESHYELVFAKIANKDYEGAINSLNNIEGMIDPEIQPEELERFTKMTTIIPILISIESGNINWEDINSSDKDYLIQLSENETGMPASIARAMRMQFEPDYVYNEPIYIIGEIQLKKAVVKKTEVSVSNEQMLKVAPNPANEFITLSYNFCGINIGLKLIITDALGKPVYERELPKPKDNIMLVISDFAKGNYFCTIFNNGKPIQSAKFIKK